MIGDQELIQKLVDTGHCYAPEVLALGGFPGDLSKLTLADPVVKLAVRSYQDWFKADLDRLTMRAASYGGHNRAAIADGDVGDCTRLLLTLPRCGCPDYQHPAAIVEEGNWPEQCRKEITTSYRMSLSGISDSQLAALWQEADKNWSDVLDVGFQFRPQDYPRTRFHAKAERMGGSILAWHQLAVSDCSAYLAGAYDTRTWNPVLLVTTITHEHGHGLGFEHTRDPESTMYPSINQAAERRRGRPNETDLREALRRGYRREGPEPEPEPPDGPEDPRPPRPGKWTIKVPGFQITATPEAA